MKIYTEVNYKWENGKLIETSSDSFEYSGDITLCGGGGGGGGNIITKAASRIREGLDDTVAIAKDPTGQMREGLGKGSLGQLGGKLYGGSFKQLGDAAQGKTDDDGDVAAPDLSAEEIDPQGALVAQQKKRKEGAGRGAANLTAGQTATMLTS